MSAARVVCSWRTHSFANNFTPRVVGGRDEVQRLVVACEHVDEREPPVLVLLGELEVLSVQSCVRARANLLDILDRD